MSAAVDYRRPPPDVSPEELFAIVAEPQPMAPISFRLDVAPTTPLFVRAVQGGRVLNAQRQGRPELYLSAALCDANGRQLVRDPDILTQGTTWSELLALSAAVWGVLDRICPMFHRCNSERWHQVLGQGMRLNGSILRRMFQCVDTQETPSSMFLQERPDRYYGVPMSALLDGHLMVFALVRDHLKNRMK